MSDYMLLPEESTTLQDLSRMDWDAGVRYPLPASPQGADAFTAELCRSLEEAGAPLALSLHQRLRFETLLAELSATFVNVSADQFDSAIESAWRRLVELLGIDCVGVGDALEANKQLVITHSYHAPRVPPLPRIIVNQQLPWYGRTVERGEVSPVTRLPAELSPEARHEREFCTKSGLTRPAGGPAPSPPSRRRQVADL
jgi:hypothetical protein